MGGGFEALIGSGRAEFFGTMFINVHDIVHDFFSCFVKGINLVRALVHGVVEFWISVIFVNNWAILIFVSASLKCHECSVYVGLWRLMDAFRFKVVHKVLTYGVNLWG